MSKTIANLAVGRKLLWVLVGTIAFLVPASKMPQQAFAFIGNNDFGSYFINWGTKSNGWEYFYLVARGEILGLNREHLNQDVFIEHRLGVEDD